MSFFRPVLFVCVSRGNTEEMIKYFNLTPSLNDMILTETIVTPYGPFNVLVDSFYTLTLSSGRIKWWVAGGSLLRSGISFRFSALMFSISDLGNHMASERSAGVGLVWDGARKLDMVRNNSSDGISLFDSIVFHRFNGYI